jgi:hypothetical protein
MCVILLRKKKRVNIVIIKSSHRHDLILLLCVNHEVLNFNKQVEKKMKIYNDVKILETTENTLLSMVSI